MSANATPIILGQRITPRPAQSGSPSSDLQNVLGKLITVVMLRKWFFIIPLLTGLIVALTASMFLPRRYTVTTIIQRQDHDVITKLVTNRTPYDFEAFRKSLRVDMYGHNAMSRALAQIGLTQSLPRDEKGQLTLEGQQMEREIIESWNRQITVGLMETSPFMDLIQIRYVGKEPETGTRLVDQLKNNYVEFVTGRIQNQLRESHTYFQREREKTKEKVSRMEMSLGEMIRQYPGIDPATSGQLDTMINDLDGRIREYEQKRTMLDTNVKEHERLLSELHQAASGTGPQGSTTRPAILDAGWATNPEYQRVQGEIDNVRKKIDEEKTINGRTDFHPVVKALRDKQQLLEERLNQIPPRVESRGLIAATPNAGKLGPIEAQRGQVAVQLKNLGLQLAVLDEEIQKARQQRDRLEEERKALPNRQHEYLSLKKNLETEVSHLRRYTQCVEELERVLNADEDKRGINFTTLLEASAPAKPSSPALKGVYFLSAVVGLALAIISTFLREVFDRSFRNPIRVQEALGIPVLGTIGEIRQGQGPGDVQARLLGILTFGETLVVIGLVVLVYINLEKPLVYGQLLNRLSGLWPG